MFKYCRWLIGLLALACRAEKEIPGTPLTVSLIACETTANGAIFKKPPMLSTRDWLWQLLEEATIKKDLGEQSLQLYANTIKHLCSLNPSLREKDEYHKLTPYEFALTYCPSSIDRAFVEDANASGSVPCDKLTAAEREKSRRRREKLAKKLGQRISKHVPKEFFTDDPFTNSTIIIDANKETAGYSWTCTFKNASAEQRSLQLKVAEDADCIGYLDAVISFTCWGAKIEIEWHDVIASRRNQGLGSTLLLVAIELFKKFKSFTKVIYLAAPTKMSEAPDLVDYYKERGFIPSAKAYQYLKLYISKFGSVIKPADVHAHQKLRRLAKAVCACNVPPENMGAKNEDGMPSIDTMVKKVAILGQFFTPQSPRRKKKQSLKSSEEEAKKNIPELTQVKFLYGLPQYRRGGLDPIPDYQKKSLENESPLTKKNSLSQLFFN